MTTRAALIGYGLAGRLLHAPLLKPAGIEVAAIVTSRREQAQADFPDAAVLSLDAALARADIDLAIVVTPDNLHVPHAQAALEAGKHVVVDKPFAPASEDALGLIALAEQRGRMLTVFQNRRWDADFLTLRKLIADGALGDVVYYAARWDRYRVAARGDWHDADMLGELYGLGPHLIDQALLLFGAPDWLQADVYNQRGLTPHNDGFDITLGKGRLRVTLGVNLLAADEAKTYRILGTKASFSKAGLDPQEPHLRGRGSVSDAAFGVEPESAWGTLTEGAAQASRHVRSERGDWVSFYRGVRAALESGAPPPVDPRDAARVIAVMEAAMESAAQGIRIDMRAYMARKNLA